MNFDLILWKKLEGYYLPNLFCGQLRLILHFLHIFMSQPCIRHVLITNFSYLLQNPSKRTATLPPPFKTNPSLPILPLALPPSIVELPLIQSLFSLIGNNYSLHSMAIGFVALYFPFIEISISKKHSFFFIFVSEYYVVILFHFSYIVIRLEINLH